MKRLEELGRKVILEKVPADVNWRLLSEFSKQAHHSLSPGRPERRWRMSVRVVLDLPEDVFSILRTSPGEFGRELRLAAAVKWYELGKVSQEKAAGLAGLSRTGFIEALGRFGVSPIQVTEEELEREISFE